MNIFILDESTDLSAKYHVDKHVIKMPLEAAQLLTTALWMDKLFGYIPRKLNREEALEVEKIKRRLDDIGPENRQFSPYLPSFYNHPCSVWVRSSFENYAYTFNYLMAVSWEYTYRYGKVHKCETIGMNLPFPKYIKEKGLTPFALAVSKDKLPSKYYNEEDPIQTYRNFYMLDKATFASWKFRNKPEWWDEQIANYETRLQ